MGGHEEEDAREVTRQRRIADACTGADGDVGGRLGLYRRLVQNNLAVVARRLLPRTSTALDDEGADGFEAWFKRFLAESGPTTPYLRDVPAEFVRWAKGHWVTASDVPPFLSDLARYEIDLFEIETAPRSPIMSVTEVALDRPLVFARPMKLAHYDHAVHAPEGHVETRTTHLLLHRDEDNEVHSRVVDESKHELLALLLQRVPVQQALARTPSASPEDVARWLAELGESGALLGGEG